MVNDNSFITINKEIVKDVFRSIIKEFRLKYEPNEITIQEMQRILDSYAGGGRISLIIESK